jgi:transcriptional regulator with XRE-family HTH domain
MNMQEPALLLFCNRINAGEGSMSDQMIEKNLIGEKIRKLREVRSLTLTALAERSRLSETLISQLESGELVPSLSPLIKIARSLGVRLGTFLDDQEDLGPVVSGLESYKKVVHFSDKDHPGHSDLDFYSLAANKGGRHMEPFIIEIYPSSAEDIHLSAHEGEEFLYVLSGEVEVAYGRDTYHLNEGQSIYYDSLVPHHVHCSGHTQAKILAVVYGPF